MNGKQAKELRKLVECGVKNPTQYTITSWGHLISIGKRQKYKVAKRLYMNGMLYVR